MEMKSHRIADAALKIAKADKAPPDKIQELEYDAASEGWYFGDEIRKLHSKYLCRLAARMLIPLPDLTDKEMWEHEPPHYVHLTERGINHIRTAIRAEKKARVELLLMWMPGVVGELCAEVGDGVKG